MKSVSVLSLLLLACVGTAYALTTGYTVINSNPNNNGVPGKKPMALATFSDQRTTAIRCAVMERAGTSYLCGFDTANTLFCTRTGGAANPNYYSQLLNQQRPDLLGIFTTTGATRYVGTATFLMTMDVPLDGHPQVTASYAAAGIPTKTSVCNIGSGGLTAAYTVTSP
jgi:hypothetical protein